MESISSLNRLTYYRGRVGLFSVLKALGIGPGDQVALQAFTCLANPEAIMASGAEPLYIDIEANGVNMCPEDLAKKLNSKVKAVIVQHTYGIPANLAPLLEIAGNAKLPVIEDCCHTICSEYQGKRLGGFGIAAFYSFEWGKPIAAGLGGSVIVNDPELAEKVETAYRDFAEPGKSKQYKLWLQSLAHRTLYRPALFWRLRQVYHFLGRIGVAESNYNPVSPDAPALDFSLKMPPGFRKNLARKIGELPEITAHGQPPLRDLPGADNPIRNGTTGCGSGRRNRGLRKVSAARQSQDRGSCQSPKAEH